MRVLLLAAGQDGCAKYRVYEPARVTSSLGVDVEVSGSLPALASQDVKTLMTTVEEVTTDVDLIVFQRPLDNSMHSAIIQAKKQGIATIVELDDDIIATSKDNHAFPFFNTYKHSNVDWLMKSCAEADYVITSTPSLQGRYALNGRGTVIRNYVPESIFDVAPRYDRVDELSMIGWTGSLRSHPNDLQVTKGVVGKILKDNSYGFTVVGDIEGVPKNLGISPSTPTYSSGWVSLDSYYEVVANSMDIGIVPLERSIFNEGKSYLKGLEMAALGIPFVASDSYEYSLFSSYGVGVTARNPSDWRKHLTRLIENPRKTRALAVEYRDRIRSGYTYEQHASEWVRAWESAVTIRKNSHD